LVVHPQHRIELVSDLPPDLPRLYTLRTWHAMWVDRLDNAIAAAEQREAEKSARGSRPAARTGLADRTRLAGPQRRVRARRRLSTWRGNGPGPPTEDQARQALAGGTDACPHCRPDTALGVLD
jgi:hypothetical protein